MRHPHPGLSGPASIVAAFLLLSPLHAAAQLPDVFTWHNDNQRTGQDLKEPVLAPANVNSTKFGKLFQVPMDGKVDAEPLYVSAIEMFNNLGTRNVVYAATEHDTVYAFDAESGQVFWKKSVLGTGETPSDTRGCTQLTPEIGITATPVISRRQWFDGSIYVVAMSKDASGNYHQRLHALDLTTGAEQFGGPVEIQASVPGTGAGSTNGVVKFDPGQYKDRAGLLLSNNHVYVSFGSHCDIQPFTGWLISYQSNSLQQKSVFNFAPNGSDAGLWNSGAGPAADNAGNVFAATGNGTFDTTLDANGFPVHGDYGNAVVRLATANNVLKPTDYWTMFDNVSESTNDLDLGSGGLMLLPNLTDSLKQQRSLAVAAGKDSNLYLLDRNNMGKFDANSNATVYQELPGALANGVFGSPAYFNKQIYYGPVGAQLRAYALHLALLSAQPASTTQNSFGYPGTTPSVSAFRSGQGIVWAVENSDPAVLHAYDATNLAKELYNSSQAAGGRDQFGPGNKFITPTIANDKVYVGTQNSVVVFGTLPLVKPIIADGLYTMQNQSSGLLLDDPLSLKTPGQQMIQFTADGGTNQRWLFLQDGNGYFHIQNAASGLLLSSLPAGLANPGDPLEQQLPTYDDRQLWSLVPSGPGYFITNKASGLVIDDTNRSPTPGTGMILWVPDGYPNQVWELQLAN